MKNYDELTNDLLERRDRYVADQKKKRKKVMGIATSLCCFCLVALLGFGMWQGGMFSSKAPITLDDSINVGEKDYIEPDELDKSQTSNDQNVSTNDSEILNDDSTNKDNQGDVLGMVIIDDVTYIQFHTNPEAYTIDAYLGYATDYEGTYKTRLNDIEAKLYTAKEDSNILIVKLGNGGTVILKKAEF
ncbi:MAG: hypothetical protein IKU48_02730 [Clostridia bacterium]|nr:hypothetical protein [Clostridia bacterium]